MASTPLCRPFPISGRISCPLAARRSWGPSWRQARRGGGKDPWLCGTGFGRLCLCRGNVKRYSYLEQKSIHPVNDGGCGLPLGHSARQGNWTVATGGAPITVGRPTRDRAIEASEKRIFRQVVSHHLTSFFRESDTSEGPLPHPDVPQVYRERVCGPPLGDSDCS